MLEYAIASALVIATAAPSAQIPVFRAGVRGVRVDVLATSGGHPVDGLGTGSFELRDNGVLQEIEVKSGGALPVDVLLAVDASASVRGQKLEALRTAGRALLDALSPDDRTELITFNESVRIRKDRGSDPALVERSLSALVGTGATALVDASLAALLAADSTDRRTLVVILSDGVDTASFTPPELVMETARASGVTVYAIWTGSGKRPGFLAKLTDVSSGRTVEVGAPGSVAHAVLAILQEFRQRYAITYTPKGVAAGGWHRLDVRVRGRDVRVKHREGYYDSP